MKSYSYPATINKSRDGTYDVQFVNFKEGFTYGNTLAEARDNACEVLSKTPFGEPFQPFLSQTPHQS